MFEAFRADPCRVLETLADPTALYRIWRNLRNRGAAALLDEVSVAADTLPSSGQPVNSTDSNPCPSAGALVFIDATLPKSDRDAGGRSSYLYIKLLREMGYEVFFMPNDQLRREPYARSLEELGVKLLIGSSFRCGNWKQWLKKHRQNISAVIVNRPNVAKRYVSAIKKIAGIRVVYFACDLRSLREQRHFELSGDRFHRWEAKYWEKVERRLIAQADKAYFFSDEEVRAVASWVGGARAQSLPLFPVRIEPISAVPFDQRKGLLFVGGFAHQPNVDGIIWFANEVLPLIQKAINGVTLQVVGAHPPKDLQGREKIELLGYVTESQLVERYERSLVVIAPLRFGAGVKGKVVEALIHRVPLVTTTIGAEGLSVSPQTVDICDDPVTFAKAVIRLHQEREHWIERRKNMELYAAESLASQRAIDVLQESLKT
jgi:glycosyltransferase involved in cell wall biosynthesis